MRRGNYVKGIDRQLKALARECIASDGTILDLPRYKYFKNPNDRQRDELAIGLAQLLFDTTYFCVATKVYLSSFYMSKSDVADKLKEVGMELPLSTVTSRIRSDLIRFTNDFGADVIVALFEDLGASIEIYQHKLSEIEAKKNGLNCELDELRPLLVPYGIEDSGVDIMDADIEFFLETIRPYTAEAMEKVERSLDKRTCYYVRRLLSNGGFGEKEERHENMLRQVLSSKNVYF